MAYVSKQKKAILVAAAKAVLPKGWKATFAVRNLSTIVCTVRSAPFDLSAKFPKANVEGNYITLNSFCVDQYTNDQELAKQLQALVDALDTGNHNNSDAHTDYFDVGHYITLQFGEYNKPFVQA